MNLPAHLVVTGLACARGGAVIVEDVNFTLKAGEALVLRGPNGSGKTTLLRTLAGLQPPFAGEISAPPEAVTYAGHSDGIKPTLTVAENLSFWARVHGLREIAPALSAMNLTELAARDARNLSAGQKRRLGLARLLVTGRAIWLLDEPTISLDAASVALFGAAVRGHLARGGIAVIATHTELGIEEAAELELDGFRARLPDTGGAGDFDEAFL